MSVALRPWRSFKVFLQMVKIEHSIFALPFAMLGMMWAADGWPGWHKFLWIVAAMVSARSAAMAFNRIADRHIDALNPRTRDRAIPAGLLRLADAALFLVLSIVAFLLSAAMLNSLTLALAPVALAVSLGYSLTKRFTPLSHFVLGLSLGIAPAGAWIAVRGDLDPRIGWLTGAVLLWTAGFDIIYALQDDRFDQEHGLRSLPQTLGRRKSLLVSRVCHGLSLAMLIGAGLAFGVGPAYFAGVVVAAALLAYEQSLVKPDDLSRIDLAFFTLNGYVSIGLFLFAWLDRLLRGLAS
ncbi:MAG: putative 4-hydroxybenzoate polyprenyltransferase [Fimbriimonadales bacterium]|nr:putative 4-hydroxybenzoate polyprenyltransferase [Fimbriimonadales bacterium]